MTCWSHFRYFLVSLAYFSTVLVWRGNVPTGHLHRRHHGEARPDNKLARIWADVQGYPKMWSLRARELQKNPIEVRLRSWCGHPIQKRERALVLSIFFQLCLPLLRTE